MSAVAESTTTRPSKAEVVRWIRKTREATRGIELNLYGAEYDPEMLRMWAEDVAGNGVEVAYAVAALLGDPPPTWCTLEVVRPEAVPA